MARLVGPGRVERRRVPKVRNPSLERAAMCGRARSPRPAETPGILTRAARFREDPWGLEVSWLFLLSESLYPLSFTIIFICEVHSCGFHIEFPLNCIPGLPNSEPIFRLFAYRARLFLTNEHFPVSSNPSAPLLPTQPAQYFSRTNHFLISS